MLEGLQNTVMIAVVGLLVGVLIGTLIASVRVMPKYKLLPRVLNGFCSFYVGLFRGTPMVVQLLVCYYVLLPLLGAHMTGVQVDVYKRQVMICLLQELSMCQSVELGK